MGKLLPDGHIVLTVKNLKKSSKWYKEVLGWLDYSVAFEDNKNIYFKNKEVPIYIAIFQGKKKFEKDKFNRYRVGFHHLALKVKSKKIVDEFYEFLKSKRVNIVEPPKNILDYGDKLYYAVFFNDPDDLRLEVVYEEH
ncbi:VOC family protein [Candidatus Woesearchaeota archaeon]|nr:VOC family protein [Candidatus Woesearchaeota archaeon]